jgi:hypothetical protein
MLSFEKNNMNKSWIGIVGIAFIIFCSLYSCKKNSSAPAKRVITYKLTSSNYAPFSSVSYTDTLGVQSVVSAVDSTSGWSKTISESYTGFTAVLQVQGQNSSTNQLDYTLEILVDGVSKSTKQDSIKPFGSFNTQTSVIIQ